MKRIMIRDTTPIPPFGEPARDLRILNKQLWLLQRDLLAPHCEGGLEIDSVEHIPTSFDDETVVCKDNLFFNDTLIETFLAEARASGHACQIAFSQHDRAITRHAIPLQEGIRLQGDVYVADLYYYPAGLRQEPQPLVIDTQPYEMGYYHIPSYMAPDNNELVFQVPNRAFLSIENWVHIYIANTPMGVFQWARYNDEKMQRGSLRNIFKWNKGDWKALVAKLKLVTGAFVERINPFEEHWRNHFLSSRGLVKVGKNCSIDPSAIIHGPTVIGDNVYIGPGTVIANSFIGNHVNIMQGCQVMLSVISDRCFLPFNSAYFMSSMMENSMVAQNTTLQLSVVGRNTFIGANNCFTDFNLRGEPIRTYHQGRLEPVNMPVLGSAIGHNCKIGSGFVMYPGRMVGSNTTLILDQPRVNLLHKNINVPDIDPALNIPGLEDDDDEGGMGEKRQTIYRWPHIADEGSNERDDPNNGNRQPPAAEDVYQTDHGDIYADNHHEMHVMSDTPEPQGKQPSESLQVSAGKSYTQALHAGG